MWCAGHFGLGVQSFLPDCAILIGDTDQQTDVDFLLEAGGQLHKFQITEVQTPSRRRGDEYKHGRKSDEEGTKGTEYGAQWICSAIEKKAKQYGKSDDLNLLVYVNFPARGMQFDEVRSTASAFSARFSSVWLLSGNALCCIHSSGQLPETNGWLRINESASET